MKETPVTVWNDQDTRGALGFGRGVQGLDMTPEREGSGGGEGVPGRGNIQYEHLVVIVFCFVFLVLGFEPKAFTMTYFSSPSPV